MSLCTSQVRYSWLLALLCLALLTPRTRAQDAKKAEAKPADAVPAKDAPAASGEKTAPAKPATPNATGKAESAKPEAKEQPAKAGPPKPEPVKSEPAKSGSPKLPPADASRNGPADDAPPDPNERVSFHFAGREWEPVIREFAQYWRLALHNSSWPGGKFYYTDPRHLNQKEQMDVINAVLLTKGFVLARRDRMLLLHNLQKDGPVPEVWVPLCRQEDVGELGEFELRKVMFKVDRTDFDTVEKEVRNIVERPSAAPGTTSAPDGVEVKLPGKVMSMPASKMLMVTETGGNLRSIDALIRGLSGDGVKSFKVDHITLSEAMSVIKPLLGLPADLNQNTDGSIAISEYSATNSLLVKAKPDVLKQVEQILKMINVERKPVVGPDVPRPEFKIYPVAGDSQTIEKILQTMLAGIPGVRLTRDPSNGNIVALCLPEQHATIKETIQKMEGEGLKKFKVWQLASSADPALVLATITEMLGAGGTAATTTTDSRSTERSKVAPVMSGAPKIAINTNNRSMLAFGTDAQLKQIDELLTVQKWSDAAVKETGPNRSTVRLLPFHRDAVELIKQHFPSIRKNPIEVRIPSERGGSSQIEPIDPRRAKQLMHPQGNPFNRPVEGEKTGAKAPAERTPAIPASPDGSGERTTLRLTRPTPATYVALRLGEIGDQPRPAAGSAGRAPLPMKRKASFVGAERLPEPSGEAGESPDGIGRSPETRSRKTAAPAEAPADSKPPAAKPQPPAKPQPATAQPPKSGKGIDLPGSPDEPVIITVTDKGFIISSKDPEALDAVEELLALLPADPVASGNFKIYYLKHIPAATAKAELDQILTGDTTESGGTTASGNLVGDVARSTLGSLGGSLVEGLLSSGSAGGVGSLVSGTALIVPDDRLNALIVQASPAEQSIIEQVLYHIDAEDGPDTKVARKPGMIPVFSTNAEEIAAIVKELYQDRMIGGRGGANQQPNPQQFFEALRGATGGGGRNQRNRRNEDLDRMSVSVDARSNSLVVVAPQPLFEEVQYLVRVLDYASQEPTNDVRKVVKMTGINADALSQALKAIAGEKVQTMTAGPTTTPGAPSTTTPGTPFPQTATAPTGDFTTRALQMQQFFPGSGRFPGIGGPGSFRPGGGGGPGSGGPGSGPGGGRGFRGGR
jgi:hypothetical protein